MKYYTVTVVRHDFVGRSMCCYPTDVKLEDFEVKNFHDLDTAVDYASNVVYPALVEVLKKYNRTAKRYCLQKAQLEKMYEFTWKDRADILVPTEGLEFNYVDFDLEKYWGDTYWDIQIREAELKFEDED